MSQTWEMKKAARREFCSHFVREHHPGMADAAKIKSARPLVPLDPARRFHDDDHYHWWLETNESISALGGTWIAHLFDRHGVLDHEWFIGRSDQEPWALVSEPYGATREDRGVASRASGDRRRATGVSESAVDPRAKSLAAAGSEYH